MTTRTFDCCIVHSEIDMLELRLQTLRDAVDYHIVVESGMTHSGLPKRAILGDALQTARFAPYADKVIYVYADRLQGDHSWVREHNHRGLISGALSAYAEPDDWVIVGDVDEIPNPDALARVSGDGGALEMTTYYYDFAHRVDYPWGIGMLRWRDEQDANKIRTFSGHSVPHIANGGWHLSYFMTPQQVVEKLNAFMHHGDVAKDVPRDPVWIADQMRNGVDLFGRTLTIERVTVDEAALPHPVRENRAKYEALGWLEREREATWQS